MFFSSHCCCCFVHDNQLTSKTISQWFFILGTRSKSFDSIQLTKGLKLTLPSSHRSSIEDINNTASATLFIPNQNGRQTLSTDCLADSSYPTSAKLNEHFPQKVLTPSNSIRIVDHPGQASRITRSSSSSSRTPSSERLNSISVQAPVATLDDQVSTPSECAPEDIETSVKEDDSHSANSNTSSGSRSSKKVRK